MSGQRTTGSARSCSLCASATAQDAHMNKRMSIVVILSFKGGLSANHTSSSLSAPEGAEGASKVTHEGAGEAGEEGGSTRRYRAEATGRTCTGHEHEGMHRERALRGLQAACATAHRKAASKAAIQAWVPRHRGSSHTATASSKKEMHTQCTDTKVNKSGREGRLDLAQGRRAANRCRAEDRARPRPSSQCTPLEVYAALGEKRE